MPTRPLVLALAAVGALLTSCVGTSSPAAPSRPHAGQPRAVQTTTPAGSGPRATPSASPPLHLIASARWEQTAQGHRLQVKASLIGRNHAYQDPPAALRQALRDAGDPAITTALTAAQHESLLNQLRCHAVFAQRKPFWDLEDWRPNVGYLQTVENLCNP